MPPAHNKGTELPICERLTRGVIWSNGDQIGAVVGAVNDPVMREAAAMLQTAAEALAHYSCGKGCSYRKGKYLMPDGRCPREHEGGCGKIAFATLERLNQSQVDPAADFAERLSWEF